MTVKTPKPPVAFTPELRERFLELLEETCSPKRAAEACGIHRRTAFEHKQRDAAFRARWEAALETALDGLLGEAYARATEGKSDRLLEVLLKFRFGDRMAERLRVKVEAQTGLSFEALQRMSEEDQARLVPLLERYAEAEREALAEADRL